MWSFSTARRGRFLIARRKAGRGWISGNALRCSIVGRHTPRKRSIQYAATLRFIIGALEYWVARSSRAMTTVSVDDAPNRHSGASRSDEPGIHNHDREYGFRACAKRRIPE